MLFFGPKPQTVFSRAKTVFHGQKRCFMVVSRQFHDSFTLIFRTVHTRAQQDIFNHELLSQYVQKDSFCSRQVTRLNSLTICCKLIQAFTLNALLYNRSLGTFLKCKLGHAQLRDALTDVGVQRSVQLGFSCDSVTNAHQRKQHYLPYKLDVVKQAYLQTRDSQRCPKTLNVIS